MFNFLKMKYVNQKEKTQNRALMEVDTEQTCSSVVVKLEAAVTTPSCESTAYCTISQTNSAAGFPQPSSAENQLVYSAQGETRYWQLSNMWQQPQSQEQMHTLLLPTRTEMPPHDVQQHMIRTPVNGSTAAMAVQHEHQQHTSIGCTLPSPVSDIYNRLVDKRHQVTVLPGYSAQVGLLLSKVDEEVISFLYSKLRLSAEVRLCLMFIDAAHQFEALLDVLVVLGRIDVDFFNSGCQELINKFNRECVPVMSATVIDASTFQWTLGSMKGPLSYLLGSNYADQPLNQSCFPTNQIHTKSYATIPVDEVDNFGVVCKRTGLDKYCIIEKRNTIPLSVSDDEFYEKKLLLTNGLMMQTHLSNGLHHVDGRGADDGCASVQHMDYTSAESLQDIQDIDELITSEYPELQPDLETFDAGHRVMSPTQNVEPYSLLSSCASSALTDNSLNLYAGWQQNSTEAEQLSVHGHRVELLSPEYMRPVDQPTWSSPVGLLTERVHNNHHYSLSSAPIPECVRDVNIDDFEEVADSVKFNATSWTKKGSLSIGLDCRRKKP